MSYTFVRWEFDGQTSTNRPLTLDIQGDVELRVVLDEGITPPTPPPIPLWKAGLLLLSVLLPAGAVITKLKRKKEGVK